MNLKPTTTPFSRDRYREGLVEWITYGLSDHDLFVTHAFNRTINDYSHLRKMTLELWKRMDRKALGAKFTEAPHLRTTGLFFAEHINSNTHVHGVLRAPYLESKEDWGLKVTEQIASRVWKEKLVRGGTFDMQAITDREGLALYVTKEFRRHDFKEGYFLASELWPSKKAS